MSTRANNIGAARGSLSLTPPLIASVSHSGWMSGRREGRAHALRCTERLRGMCGQELAAS
jgi:hypothetical protein